MYSLLYNVSKSFFHLAKLIDAKEEEEHHYTEAEEEAWPVYMALTAENTPSESVNDAYHRVERIEQSPLVGYDTAAEADRRDIQAELYQKRHDIPKVAVLDIVCSKVQPKAHACQESDDKKYGQQEDVPAGCVHIIYHESDKDNEGYEKINETGDDRGCRYDKPREIDLTNEVGVADEAIAGLAKGVGEELPRQHSGIDHDSIRGRAFGRKFGDIAEHECKDDHSEQWAEYTPQYTDYGLLIPNFDVAPAKYVEQVAVTPEVGPVVFLCPAGFDDKVVGFQYSLF